MSHCRSIVCILLLGSLFTASAFTTRKSYEGYKVLLVTPKSQNEVRKLQNLMTQDEEIDFWSHPHSAGEAVKLLASPTKAADVTRMLRALHIRHKVVNKNVQQQLEGMWSDVDANSRAFGDMDLNEFNTLHKINKWLNKTASECPLDLQCQVYSLGQSYEGRPINVFKISKPGYGRKAYWIDATIHAREWIATATAVKIIDHLSARRDLNARRLVNSYDWYILPVMNPDGYTFTFTGERYWRKNRHPNTGHNCVGVDLNRNFDVKWGTEGVSHYQCSEIYCGPSAASEPETVAVQDESRRLAPSLRAWLTLHSYGRMWMFPYATTTGHSPMTPCERVPDHDDLMEVANAAANAVQRTHGTTWRRGNSCEVIYAAAGGTDDYVKAISRVKYAFVAELRGDDFVIHKGNIQQSFDEMWNGIVAMCDAISRKEGP